MPTQLLRVGTPANRSVPQTLAEPDINQEHLQTLIDMGFPRERYVEAMKAVGGTWTKLQTIFSTILCRHCK